MMILPPLLAVPPLEAVLDDTGEPPVETGLAAVEVAAAPPEAEVDVGVFPELPPQASSSTAMSPPERPSATPRFTTWRRDNLPEMTS